LLVLHLQIALVLIDEVHLLNESRGAALEAGCISRIRMVSQLPEMKEVHGSWCTNA
jgi:replicative superfamily II helicase